MPLMKALGRKETTELMSWVDPFVFSRYPTSGTAL